MRPRRRIWSPPSRYLAMSAWPLLAGSLAACSRHSPSCAPSSVAHASSATPHRSPSRRRAPRRRRRAAARSSDRAAEQQLLPGLRALADTVGKPDEFLPAFGGGADDHEQTLRIIFEPGLDVDAIDPEVNIPLGGQVAIEPAGVFVDPSLLQARNGRSG